MFPHRHYPASYFAFAYFPPGPWEPSNPLTGVVVALRLAARASFNVSLTARPEIHVRLLSASLPRLVLTES